MEGENRYSNKVTLEIINQHITQAVSDYLRYEMLVQEQILIHEKRTGNICIVVLAIILMLVSIIMLQRIKTQKKEIENKMLLASNLRNILKVKETEAEKMQNAIKDTLEHKTSEIEAMQIAVNRLFEQRFATIDKLSSTYYECRDTGNERHRIYTDVLKLISGLGSDQRTLEELENFVNTYKGNLMSRFKSAFPELKESDRILYLYIVTGFSPRAISIFINEKLEVVYNRKSRLKQKINGSLSPEKEFFAKHLQ